MAIRFYIGGTYGLKDGTLISSNDNSVPIVFDGMYPGASATTKTVNICMRADLGQLYKMVYVRVAGTTFLKFSLSIISAPSGTNVQTLSVWNTYAGLIFPKVTDVNCTMSLTATCLSTDSGSPDIATKLEAWGVLQ